MKITAEIERLLKKLPRKYAEEIRQTSWTADTLREALAEKRQFMRNDLWFGLPWVVIYGASLIFFGFNAGTIAILVVGIAYFSYALLKNGSYGVNRKRVRIYELLLAQISKQSHQTRR